MDNNNLTNIILASSVVLLDSLQTKKEKRKYRVNPYLLQRNLKERFSIAFLPDVSNKRKTLSSSASIEDFPSTSNYSYQSNKSTTKEDGVTKLAKNIEGLIDLQKNMLNRSESGLKFPVQMANFDRMLQMLPEADVEDVCYDITTLIYNKIKNLK